MSLPTLEPVAFFNALGVLLFAVLSFLINSGVIQIAPEQQDAIKAVIGAAIALIVTFVTRSKVTPTAK